ncbi:hypothetical protein AB0M39_12985 [Streptomyces sp. NPDC051907]|uniref:hypothetical protein n=1 Tax=Streptomyces sp. NPDC051907 TaxID=3155284 RepID=UPI0034475FBC
MSSDQQYPYQQPHQPQPHEPHPQQAYQQPQQAYYPDYQDPQQEYQGHQEYQGQGHQEYQGQGQGHHEYQGQGQGHQGHQESYDSGATQTWQAETWDTHYQPVVQRPAEPHHQPHQQPVQAAQLPVQPMQPAQPAQHLAADAAYATHAASPLPPEVPAAQPYATPAAAPEYSAPTTVGGGAPMTAAQRARAEGRSQIIAPGMQPAALTAALGLLLAGGAAVGAYALVVPLVLLQAVTAAGWFRLNGMWPARQGIALAFAGGLAADVVLLAVGRGNAPAAIVGTLGVWVLLTLVLQLRSHAGADERMYGLMATVASAALAVLAAGHLAAPSDAVVIGGVAVAAAVVARALPLPSIASVAVALLVAAGAGIAAGALTDIGAQGALLGLAAGGCALIGLRVASYDYPSRFVHMTAGVALPLTAAAPAVYLIGRALV